MDKWSEGLPLDVFDRIFSLCTFSDGVRMRSVCKSWLSLSKRSGTMRCTELPWLMMLPNSEEEEKKVEFYSLSEKRFYYISIPEIRGWRCCGSFNNGWLMMINPNLEIRLFHPWRKTHLKLPHYSTLYPKRFTQPYISGRENISILKAAMSDDAAVVVILYQGGRPAYCRTREDKVWTRIAVFGTEHVDVIYHKGHFYVAAPGGEVGVLCINNKLNPYVKPFLYGKHPENGEIETPTLRCINSIRHQAYLVADSTSETESIFTVRRTVRSRFSLKISPPRYICTTLGFLVYNLGSDLRVPDQGLRKRVREFDIEEESESSGVGGKKYMNTDAADVVECLGDRVMFLGMNSSMLVKASQFPHFKGNCIYFADDILGPNRLPVERKDMGVFNLEDKTIKPLLSKKVHPLFSNPIWIMPSL